MLQAVRDLPVTFSDGAEVKLDVGFTLLLTGYSVAAKTWCFWVSEVDAKSRELRFTKSRACRRSQWRSVRRKWGAGRQSNSEKRPLGHVEVWEDPRPHDLGASGHLAAT